MLVVVGDHRGNCPITVAALVTAAEVMDAQHVVTDDVPQEDGTDLQHKTTAECIRCVQHT